MAKDTEKLIRQLSLISYLMAERRPVTALEIRRDVEGYNDMNEDAFARRFYADRAELESLGIQLTIEKAADGVSEQEQYSLARGAFHLPPIAFTDTELAALQTSLSLLDGEFAYAEPLRLALQQITWGRPNPLRRPDQSAVTLHVTAGAGGAELSQRLAKIDTAIYRRKRIEFDYFTMGSGEEAHRLVDPYQLVFQGGQFYLVGFSHERGAVRVFRLSRIRGKVAYATKAEHDFQRPADFDPRDYPSRMNWQLGEPVGVAEIHLGERIAWKAERTYRGAGEFGEAEHGRVLRTRYADARAIVSWVLALGEHARILAPAELAETYDERVALLVERHRGEAFTSVAEGRPPAGPSSAGAAGGGGGRRDREGAIRPERFARLVTLASVLIAAGRNGERLPVRALTRELKITEAELREDLSVLNVVNFGGGSYVLYAEILPSGEVEVDPEPYSDHFDRPARLLPVEAKALVAAIDLIGEHLPEGSLASAREKIVAALGEDPTQEGLQVVPGRADDLDVAQVLSAAIAGRRLIAIDYYKENEDEYTPGRVVEPHGLFNGLEGWYAECWDPAKDDRRSFRLDRIQRATILADTFEPRPELQAAADQEGWPRTGEMEAARIAHLWVAPERARWLAEERTVLAELPDGAVIVQLPYKGTEWLVREVLKEAGDAAVLEPADAREAVLAAAGRLLATAARA